MNDFFFNSQNFSLDVYFVKCAQSQRPIKQWCASGAQDNKVHEHLGFLSLSGRAILTFEIEAYPEPKVLSPSELQGLVTRYGGFKQTARAIRHVSEGFVRQNSQFKRNKSKS